MNFASFTFAAFFLGVLALRFALDHRRDRAPWIGVLVGSSLLFYAWHTPSQVFLLLLLATVGYWAGRVIGDLPPRGPSAQAAVGGAVSVGLVLLGVFKYYDYLASGLDALEAALAFEPTPPVRLALTLPLGISFYTFEMISYAVDVYRGRIAPTRRFRSFLLFLAFFPHLIAGPIVRAGDFLYQIDRRRRPRLRVMSEGAYLVIRGLFLKVVVADNLAKVVDWNYSFAVQPDANASLGLLVTVLFAFQILCDFEGYSTIARGTAYLLGFRLPLNFDSPYVAGTFREFWQRWHITLSRWLRDYLYVPLGGNRAGRWRMHLNLLIVMALGGLWHGAANTFLVWGAIHGAALAIERALGLHRLPERGNLVARVLWWIVVQTTVLVAWTFFRAPTMETASRLLGIMTTGPYGALDETIPVGWIALLLVAPIAGHLRSLTRAPEPSPMEKAVWGAVMLYALCTAYGPSKTFIYFQF